jgi:hypothetical protein
VSPSERAAAASITSGSAQSGVVNQPAAGRLPAAGFTVRLAAGDRRHPKIIYDLMLLGMFRAVRPPEESSPKR